MEDKVKTFPNWRRINLSCNLWKECPHTVKICQLYCPGRSSKQGQNSTETNYSLSISLTEVKGKKGGKEEEKLPVKTVQVNTQLQAVLFMAARHQTVSLSLSTNLV